MRNTRLSLPPFFIYYGDNKLSLEAARLRQGSINRLFAKMCRCAQ